MASAPRVRLEPPQRLARTVAAWEGEAGREWLAALPGLAREYLERWRLTPERVQQPGGNISMVVLVRAEDGTPAALKLGMVTEETREEHAALAHWDGRGAARLLRADPERGVMLLERLGGDVSLRSLPEAKAMLEAAEVVRRLWVPPAAGHAFTSLADRTAVLAEALASRRAPQLDALVDEALALRERLVADAPEPVLLHGDFHQGNVLSGSRMPWLAIDPKPLVGEPAYDLAWLVRDRLETLAASPAAQAATRRRVNRLADALDLDRERLRGWALFRAVEAGAWALSVGARGDGELLLEFAAWL
ncbi:aminoglycoside phosphotransferase family protein [Streptomyces sp. PTM05]|uniref:Aminoglycoside phosphotransferase family protein n=1 Tax=Streptantibioticus parmotrematis TaxID=2873249 RepID=A0ABS7R141_9ACTN|nr:aminoglycoside phosphotransferase family protein [Streptantibioticus parmotrematis]MBY8888888.1 aminoglycoside phosphotransferase family protein [Streptantibioticus parmotrematis]